MHIGTTFLGFQSSVLLVAEVYFVFFASAATAVSLEDGTFSVGDSDMAQDATVKSKVPLEYNEIVEKFGKIPNEQQSDNSPRSTVANDTNDFNEETQKHVVVQDVKMSSAKSPKTERSSVTDKTNSHPSAPKYMLDLYHKFSKDKYSHPMANIVRSFTNINEDNSTIAGRDAATGSGGNASRVHRLLFNVTSIDRDEDIYLAELRLYTVVEVDRREVHDGLGRRVTVNEVVVTAEGRETRSELIVSKEFHGRHSGWETIPITDAVRRWIRPRSNPRGDTHMIELRTESVGHVPGDQPEGTPAPPPLLVDINARPHNENEPLLLVFSNDRRRRRVYESSELVEMLGREVDLTKPGSSSSPSEQQSAPAEYEYYDADLAEEEYEEEGGGAAAVDVAKREKRSPYHEIRDLHKSAVTGRRRLVRETFFRGGRTEQVGSRKEDDDYLGKVDDPPHEMARRFQMVNGTADDENWEEREEGQDRLDALRFDGEGHRRQDKRQRVRRSKKKRTVPCQRKPMYVHFEDIYWNHWVIAPPGYQAYECTGKCYWPLGDKLTPTKHSVIRTMLAAYHPGKVSPPCCVPTKLDPISMLYIDDKGVATYKYKYEGMVVAECGCR